MIFILFLIFIAWFAFERAKASRIEKQEHENFWLRENEANNTRRKNLDSLSYITIPNDFLLSNLSKDIPDDDPELTRCNDILISLQNKRIFNLTGKTSTDIKCEYGPANMSTLDEYDSNFTLFAQTIYAYGEQLHKLGFDDEAMAILRYGIDSLSDISGNYKLLATLYAKYNQPEKIEELKKIAGGLDSLMKNTILRSLDEILSTL